MTVAALDCRCHDTFAVPIDDDAVEVIDLCGLIKARLIELTLVDHHVAQVRVG